MTPLPSSQFSYRTWTLLRASLHLETSPPPIVLQYPWPSGNGCQTPSLLFLHILLGALMPTHGFIFFFVLKLKWQSLDFQILWQSTHSHYLKNQPHCSSFIPQPSFFPLQTSISSGISYLTQVYDHSSTQVGNWEPSVTCLLILLLASYF